jgi:hypothetical protein
MQKMHILFTATHSMISTYFGNITIVLKLPFTRAASTNGLQRYNAFGAGAPPGEGGMGNEGRDSDVEDVAEVGVVDLLIGPRGWRPVMERLIELNEWVTRERASETYPRELKKDMLYGY